MECRRLGAALAAWIVLLSCGPSGGHAVAAAGDVVVVGVAAARAESIAAAAAAVRHEIEGVLFGTAVRRAWSPACAIHVHPDRHAFARAIGGASVAAGGATSIEFVGDQVSLRRIDVVDAADGGLPPAIPHELVHVVLADRFTAAPPPRWVDEGLATLFDDPAKQAGHDADFRRAAVHGRAWRLPDLMTLDLDPADAGRQRVFYGQSAALVRWLLARADGPTLLEFVATTAAHGPDTAARTHYGFATAAALEEAWRAEPAPAADRHWLNRPSALESPRMYDGRDLCRAAGAGTTLRGAGTTPSTIVPSATPDAGAGSIE